MRDKSCVPPNLELIVVEESFIHAKIYVIDGAYAVTGSANLQKLDCGTTSSMLLHSKERTLNGLRKIT